MDRTECLNAFKSLGKIFLDLTEQDFDELTLHSRNENAWFTRESVKLAIQGIGAFLDEQKLVSWAAKYSPSKNKRRIGLILAGNIPLVGFHDLMCTLVSGHHALVKISSKDHFLMKYVIDKLKVINPAFESEITIIDQLKNFDAVIATGSDNSARYFDYYFGKYPHIIRKNRSSIAVLTGSETDQEHVALGHDVFSYFGLGCRNVSKLFVPTDYKFDTLLDAWSTFSDVINHHKYCNNYDYQKSILLINRVPFLDTGFVLLQEHERIVSPISVVYFERYSSGEELKKKLDANKEKIQVTVGKADVCTTGFGGAQCPQLSDYADNVDTMQFLSSLN